MKSSSQPPWESKTTEYSRLVEKALRDHGFHQVNAYRYNPASIRVRVVDPCFHGLSRNRRIAMIEKALQNLPEDIQRQVLFIVAITPEEEKDPRTSEQMLLNLEFNDPSPSRF